MNIKARLGEQLRRTTLSSDSQTYNNLFARLATLFGKPALQTTHNIKYQDDEGDWVDMSSDEELLIALSLARQQGYALQLQLTEKSEKDRENVPAPSSEPIQEAFSQVAEHFLGLAQQWAPLVERIAAVAAENGLNPESIAERLASVQIIQEEPPVQHAPVQDKAVHNAWCDHCRIRIAGIRYKCLECPDFDFCGECMANHRPTHPPHDFILIERPGKCPYRQEEAKVDVNSNDNVEEKVKEEVKEDEPVHWAICDNCDERIKGIRHKCNDCRDYDLCSGCIVHAPKIHSDHTFTQIEKPIPHWCRHSAHARAAAAAAAAPVVEEKPAEVVVESPPASEPLPLVPEVNPVVENPVVPDNGNISMEKLQAALTQLEEMGFGDRRTNVQILMRNNGDIVNTIVELISELN